ncbi:hypothetical protein MLP_10520 [Microlunatus phosphovorus NM-1]|uniref:Uncharacterized protein n=1 Tax=Microlunatus phosphovorus (strain ATCC 700054 / DSM 10555 / JCM 9379 / NBRC 101784 / NCIMB 13414 / VKM Ac-1990 / NM-1) TaxID=1032480 RepID=F5XMZ3_MICPN|nr:hypothetical protein MLP_10520 [Microlunatus phosphovorus NM-1]
MTPACRLPWAKPISGGESIRGDLERDKAAEDSRRLIGVSGMGRADVRAGQRVSR